MSSDFKLFALVRFDREYLQPRTSRYSGYEAALRLYTLTELFEAYFWIVFGVTLGAFREGDAERLIQQRFAEAFHDFPSLFREWGYLLDNQLVDLFNAAKNQKMVFVETNLARFEEPAKLIPFFQSALRRQRHFADSHLSRMLLSELNFRPETILRLLEPGAGRMRVLDREEEANYFKGFVESVEYMGDFQQFYADLLEDATIVEHDRFLFYRRVKQLQAWRLNFRIRTNEELFSFFCSRADEFLPIGAIRSGVAPDLADIKAAIFELMADWGFQRAKTA